MRCRAHPSDSGVGVCAFCLRERLSNLNVSAAGKEDVRSAEVRRDPGSSAVPPLISRRSNRGKGKLSRLYPIKGNLSPKREESDVAALEPSGSNLCLLGITLGRKKGIKKASPHLQTANPRGMSPVTEEDPAEDGFVKKPSPGRCISTPSPLRRPQSPRSFASFGKCLSPLVWPSPGASAGKIHGTFNRRCGGGGGAEVASALVTNRSRKLVDLGKVW